MKIEIRNGESVYVCEKCGGILKYNGKHDAYYCEKCDEWAEPQCKDDCCSFCADRPEKPSMFKDNAQDEFCSF